MGDERPSLGRRGSSGARAAPSSGPACWSCGYDLSGQRVEGTCPECGVAIWSQHRIPAGARYAQYALVWGIVSLVTTLTCIGPLGGILAIAPLYYARLARAEVEAGAATPGEVGGAAAGRTLAWITIAVSLVMIALVLAVVFLPSA